MRTLKVRNKNALLELLLSGASFEKISVLTHLDQDEQTKQIIAVANKRNIRIETAPIRKMEKRRSGESREVLVGFLIPEPMYSLSEVLKKIYEHDQNPFFLLINRVDFESNIGVLARTAFAAGVNGLIFQGDESRVINDETLHYSLGSIARIPLIKMSIFEALKTLHKNGIPTYCLQMDGAPYYHEDLTGPAAFVVGAEGKGVSEGVANKCDKKISIPMTEGIDSLNVGVSAGIVLYEKIRQDRNTT